MALSHARWLAIARFHGGHYDDIERLYSHDDLNGEQDYSAQPPWQVKTKHKPRFKEQSPALSAPLEHHTEEVIPPD